jgi:hypothetical protein
LFGSADADPFIRIKAIHFGAVDVRIHVVLSWECHQP